jgi:hypothetical protein
MSQAYKTCEPPPNLQLFPNGDAALKKYTNAEYFIEQWVAEQQKELELLKAEKKKRRKEKAEARRIKKKAEQSRPLPKIQKIQYDPATGKPIVSSLESGQETSTDNLPQLDDNSDDGSDDDGIKRITISEVNKLKERIKSELPDFLDISLITGSSSQTQEGEPPVDVSSLVVTPPPLRQSHRATAPVIPSDHYFGQAVVEPPTVQPAIPIHREGEKNY